MDRKALMTILAAAAIGCSSSQRAENTTPPPSRDAPVATDVGAPPVTRGQRGPARTDVCPMQVEGTQVRAENLDDGVAMEFTTSGDVAELRRRVAHMASMHNQGMHGPDKGMHGGRGMGGPDKGMHGGRGMGGPDKGMRGGGGGMGGAMMGETTARAENIENGARLILVPEDPEQLDALQQRAQQMSARMSSGQCPMMERART